MTSYSQLLGVSLQAIITTYQDVPMDQLLDKYQNSNNFLTYSIFSPGPIVG